MQPPNLLARVQTPKMNTQSLHRVLIQSIRSEYNHNMSQQVYISDETWDLINQGKDQLISLINAQITATDPKADGIELGKLIIEASLSEHKWLLDDALTHLKKEFRENY
jgi:hypothetical protein